MPVAIKTTSDPSIARSAAADIRCFPSVTIAMANPAANGTRKNITGPIACVWGISANRNPPSPNAIPTAVPTPTPLKELFQSLKLDPLSRLSQRPLRSLLGRVSKRYSYLEYKPVKGLINAAHGQMQYQAGTCPRIRLYVQVEFVEEKLQKFCGAHGNYDQCAGSRECFAVSGT
jgi:hypothetical protein